MKENSNEVWRKSNEVVIVIVMVIVVLVMKENTWLGATSNTDGSNRTIVSFPLENTSFIRLKILLFCLNLSSLAFLVSSLKFVKFI